MLFAHDKILRLFISIMYLCSSFQTKVQRYLSGVFFLLILEKITFVPRDFYFSTLHITARYLLTTVVTSLITTSNMVDNKNGLKQES